MQSSNMTDFDDPFAFDVPMLLILASFDYPWFSVEGQYLDEVGGQLYMETLGLNLDEIESTTEN